MKVSQTRAELLEHLKEQIGFLHRSAQAYDEGHTDEAKRMATTIRVLLYDNPPKSISLLASLGKKQIKFYNTAGEYTGGLLSTLKLVQLSFGIKNGKDWVGYRAPLDDVPPDVLIRKIDFPQWWNQTVILDREKNKFSRSKIIRYVANKDGGAHVAPEINDEYADLTRFNSLGFGYIDSKGISQDMKDVELVTVRQICHEVLKSLKDEFPELF